MDDRRGPPARVAHEDDLCRLWAARAFPADALVTTAGSALEIIYPGRRSGMGGPDFVDAILGDAAGRVFSGDVEVHLNGRDWITHGHRADPAYNRVVLHVVLEDDGSACLRSDGVSVPVLTLASWVRGPMEEVASSLLPLQSCRASPALLTSDVLDIVRAAGKERLDAKAAMMEGQIAVLGPEQALFTAILDAAGYSRNRDACTRLAERLPIEQLQRLLAGKPARRATQMAEAVVLGLAGLLRPGVDDEALDAWAPLVDLWPLPPLPADAWVRLGVRPANRPELRLRGVAVLAARFAHVGLSDAFLVALRGGDVEDVVARFEVASETGGGTPPIGRGRAIEMAVNALVPLALAIARRGGDTELESAAWKVLDRLPCGDSSQPERHMRDLLAASSHRLRAVGALEQQGLLHLYRSFCSVRACWDCPLATAQPTQA